MALLVTRALRMKMHFILLNRFIISVSLLLSFTSLAKTDCQDIVFECKSSVPKPLNVKLCKAHDLTMPIC